MGISEPGNSNAEQDEKENSPFIRDSDRVSIWACNGHVVIFFIFKDRKAEEMQIFLRKISEGTCKKERKIKFILRN